MLVASLILFSQILLCFSQEVPTAVTHLGNITGYYKTSREGKKYEVYEGIPYALPPTGERRFEPPAPITEPWSGVFTANQPGQKCFGFNGETGTVTHGSEDCLKLNIYVPSNKSSPLPVLLYIHGGAFQYASKSPDESYFTDENVIYVWIQYRLGSLGFLSTQDDVVSGNMGLKDQVMALKWIKDNIKSFGGDSNRTTIIGLSAGGASVHYHYLSPMSAGLFHSGISLSGTAFMSWTQTEKSKEKAFKLGELVGCTRNSSESLVQCLRNCSAESLINAQKEFMPWRYNPFTPFGPVVEKSAKNPFISSTPMEIITSGKVHDLPWVSGVVSEEGLYPVAAYYNDKDAIKEINEKWDFVAPNLLDYYDTIPKENHSYVAKKIREYYLGNETVTKENFKNFTKMVGDRIFSFDAEKAAKEQAKVNKKPVFFYYYSFRASHSFSDETTNTTDNIGVDHADDLLLVYKNYTNTAEDNLMAKILVNIWTTTTKNGEPKIGLDWKKVDGTTKSLNYLHIAKYDDVQLKVSDDLAKQQFWSTIDFDENKK